MRQPLAASRHRVAQRQQAGRWRAAEIQLAVGVVLHHQCAGTCSDCENAFAPLQAQRGTTRIAKRRDQVDQPGLVLGNQLLQHVYLHTVCIDGRTDQVGPIQPEALDRGQKGRRFHNYLVTGRDHRFPDQVQRLLATGGNDQPVGCHTCALGLHEGGDAFAQRRVAFGSTVLQHRARVAGQHGVSRLAYALCVKKRGVGETTGKTDDAWFAQQLEKFADCGRLYVLESVGK